MAAWKYEISLLLVEKYFTHSLRSKVSVLPSNTEQ